MTDKSATERLRELLDERGIEHYDKHECKNNFLEWYSTWWRGIAGIRFLAIGFDMPDHPNCLYIDGAYLTPEQAIAATLDGVKVLRNTSKYSETSANHESNYERLFGTPERAARALENGTPMCDWCDKQACEENGGECSLFDYDALLEWLNQEVDE